MTTLLIILMVVAVAVAEVKKNLKAHNRLQTVSGTTVARLVTTITNDYI